VGPRVELGGTALELLADLPLERSPGSAPGAAPAVAPGSQLAWLVAANLSRLGASSPWNHALEQEGGWLRREIKELGAPFGIDLLKELDQVGAVFFAPLGPDQAPGFVLVARGGFDASRLLKAAFAAGGTRARFGARLASGATLIFPDSRTLVIAGPGLAQAAYARLDGRGRSAAGIADLAHLVSEFGSDHTLVYYQRFPAPGWQPPPELSALTSVRMVGLMGDLDQGLQIDGHVDFHHTARTAPAGEAAAALRSQIAALSDHWLVALAGAGRFLEAAAFEGHGQQLHVTYRLSESDAEVLVGQLMAALRLFRDPGAEPLAPATNPEAPRAAGGGRHE